MVIYGGETNPRDKSPFCCLYGAVTGDFVLSWYKTAKDRITYSLFQIVVNQGCYRNPVMFTQFLHEMGIFTEPYVLPIFMVNNPYIRLESLTI